jgi:hypothetical protein
MELKMSDTIAPLFTIMLDEEEYMTQRLEAAERILGFESPPDAVEATKAFLREVYKNRTSSSRDKLKAIELIRKAEDKKTAPPQIANPMEGLAERIGAARKEYLKTLPKWNERQAAKGPKTE